MTKNIYIGLIIFFFGFAIRQVLKYDDYLLGSFLFLIGLCICFTKKYD
jgi:hypothetical protein